MTSGREDSLIERYSKSSPLATSSDIKRKCPTLSISLRTIRRRLCERQLSARRPAKKTFISRKNTLARLEFAMDHVSWTETQWKNILFSDESKFNLHKSDGMLYVRRPPGTRYNPKYTIGTIKHGRENLMVRGCFSSHGMDPLVKIEGVMDRCIYLNILRDTMLPFAEDNLPLSWKFQHDNDPKHTAKIVKEFFFQG